MWPRRLVIIGSPAGGPMMLKKVCSGLPERNTCVVVIQYMPLHLNEAFVEMLDGVTGMEVKLAEHRDVVREGLMLVAPSGVHLELVDNERVSLMNRDPVNYALPSVDVAMKSVRSMLGLDVIGVTLTGMGTDGVEGIRHIRSIGGIGIAQDRDLSVTFGRPELAYEIGTAGPLVPPEKIVAEIATVRVPVRDEYDVLVARSAARREAREIGFGNVDEIKIVTSISELARNMVVHAGGGLVEIKPPIRGARGKLGLEIVAKDTGPGIPDVDEALKDGFTTGTGLGLGLGGARRLMDEFEISSQVDEGTTVWVRKWL
jgi:serine/threonine-protein kinase RsbT